MNVRKLMARLNPPVKPIPVGGSGTRYLGGSRSLVRALVAAGKYQGASVDASGKVLPGELAHGAPFTRSAGNATRGGYNPDALTATDIAHALAQGVPDRTARDLFCHLWWPDGAARTFADLHRNLHRVLLEEYAQRAQVCEVAALNLHIIETNVARWKVDERAAIRKAREALDRARERRWSSRLADYPKLVDAVLDELQAPNHCVVCEGHGVTWLGEVQVDCGSCEGTGTMAVSDRQRADALGKSMAVYQRTWAKPYEWLHQRCWRLEGQAARGLRRYLGGEEARSTPPPVLAPPAAEDVSRVTLQG